MSASTPPRKDFWDRARDFLRQSDLGERIRDLSDRGTEIADKVRNTAEAVAEPYENLKVAVNRNYDKLREGSELVQIVEEIHRRGQQTGEVLGSPTAGIQNALDWIGTAVDVAEAVRTSKSDAELAYNMGKMLFDNTAVGQVLSTAYAFAIGGDNMALVRFIAFSVCPPTALPGLIEKIGNFAARSGGAGIFDTQLEILFRESRFAGDQDVVDTPTGRDKDAWVLVDFAGYGPGVAGARAWIDDVMAPGGYRAVLDMIGRKVPRNRLSDNQLGNEAVAKLVVVKAMRQTLHLGDHVVMRDEGDLAEAAARIAYLTDAIVDIAANLGRTVPRDPETFELPADLSPGETTAIAKLVAKRAEWVEKAKNTLASAMVRSFEERRRAETELTDSSLRERLTRLEELLARLGILEEGLAGLAREGEYPNVLQRRGPLAFSDRAQQMRMMQAILRYTDAYDAILDIRTTAVPLVQALTGRRPEPPLLFGAPPFCGDRTIDHPAAAAWFETTRSVDLATRRALEAIKRAPLGGAFDERIRMGLNGAAIEGARHHMTSTIALACARHTTFHATFTDRARLANEAHGAANADYDRLMAEFRAFYAGLARFSAKIIIDPASPIERQRASATVEADDSALPAGTSWTWSLLDGDRQVGRWSGRSIRFDAPVRGRYTLRVEAMLDGVALRKVDRAFDVQARNAVVIDLQPKEPKPSAAVAATARLARPIEGIEWRWTCRGCSVTAAKGPQATLAAPDSGRAVVRVEVVPTAKGATVPLAVGEATFGVDADRPPVDGAPTPDLTPPETSGDPTKPDAAKPTTVGPETPPVTPETPTETKTDGKKKIGFFDGPAPVVFPAVEVASWTSALYSREAYLRLLARQDLTPAQREQAKSTLTAIEARQKAYWDAAVAETKLAEEHLGRERRAVIDAHASFRARAPAAPDTSGTVVDLDGDGPPNCRLDIDSSERSMIIRIAVEIDRVIAARKALANFSPEWKVYEPAMRAWDQTSIDEGRDDWRKGGLKLTLKDPCGGSDATIALPAVKTPDLAAPLPVAAPDAIAVKLALAPGAAGLEVEVIATVSGGRAPLRFDFVAAKNTDGPRATYVRPATKNVAAKAVVKVTDADGRSASAELPLTTPKVAVDLAKTEPAGRTVSVGGTARFRASLTVDGRPADPTAWVLRWEPSTEVRFGAEEGPGVDANAATFQRPGNVKIWVVALARDGGA